MPWLPEIQLYRSVKFSKIIFQEPKVDAELALLLLKSRCSMLDNEMADLMESLLSATSDCVELEPSEDFLFTEGKEFLILSNIETLSSVGSISMTSLGGALYSSSVVDSIKIFSPCFNTSYWTKFEASLALEWCQRSPGINAPHPRKHYFPLQGKNTD